MFSLIAGIASVIAGLVLVGSVAYGLFGYSEPRAQRIRSAEAEDHENAHVVIEEIRYLRIGHPEIVALDRIDRHWAYTCLCLALWCYGWSIFLGAAPTPNLSSLGEFERMLFAGSIFIGTSITLVGSLLGQRIGKWTIAPSIADNDVSARLGDDIRIPYMFASTGMATQAGGMLVFGFTSVQRNGFGALGGWLSIFTVLMAILLTTQMWMRIRQYTKARAVVIADAIAHNEREAASDEF